MNAADAPADGQAPGVRAGDLVISEPPVEAVGRVDAVLETSRGRRLVVERAYAPGTFVVLDGAGLTPAGAVGGAPGAPGVAATQEGPRWIVTAARPAALLAGGVYRRVLGRLQPDPLAPGRGAPEAPADDAVVREALAAALRADDLLAGSEVRLAVRHGVALLEGWVGTVAAKVQAYRLARGTPGIWEAYARLASDEETRLVVRDALRAHPDLAAAVGAVAADLGRVTVTLLPGAAPAVAAGITAVAGGVFGVRAVAARAAAPGE
jgi:hypothetical protein